MIKLIGRVAAACALLCAGLTTLAIGLAPPPEAPPFPDYAALGFDDCRFPCYAGLHPGETPFESASALLQAHIPQPLDLIAIDAVRLRFQERSPRPRLLGMIYEANGTVGAVEVLTPLPLRWLLDELGAPDCIISGDPQSVGGLHFIIWLTPDTAAWASVDATHRLIGASHQVYALTLLQTDQQACWGDLLPWHGFAPAWRYRPPQ